MNDSIEKPNWLRERRLQIMELEQKKALLTDATEINAINQQIDVLEAEDWLEERNNMKALIDAVFDGLDDDADLGAMEELEEDEKTAQKRLYFDLDNVLVDFKSGLDQVPEEVKARYADDGTGKPHYDDIPGIFSLMSPMPGAIEAFHELAKKYEVYILSTAPWNNSSAWSDKLLWVQKYLGKAAYKRLILSHHKDLNGGDYLIDDKGKNGTSKFEGEWIHFGSEQFPAWDAVLQYLLGDEK